MTAELSKPKAKDENDRLRDGTLPANPGDDATVIPLDSSGRRMAEALAAKDAGPPLPADVPAEASLLAALLWCGTYASNSHSPNAVIDLIDRPGMMSTRAHQAIWSAMLRLQAQSIPCDLTAVHSELVRARAERIAGGLDYLEQLVAGAVPTNGAKLRAYASSIREAWGRRQLIGIAKRLDDGARVAKTGAAELALSFATELTENAGHVARDESFVHVNVPLDRTLAKAMRPGAEMALSTGFANVDKCLLGGLKRRQVTILAARTSVGKSALALEMAIHAHERSPTEGVLYVSMEMTEEEFTDRMLSSRAEVDMDAILHGTVSQDAYDRLLKVRQRLRTDEIFFNIRQDLTLSQIRTIATKVSRELATRGKRLGLIVIDHLGLVKPETKKPSREQEVAEISRGLRTLANDFDCHVMSLAQISREAEKQNGGDQMPKLHHLRESGAIEQDTNNVLILHRKRDKDGMFVKGEPAKLSVAKARNGRLGVTWLAVQPKFVRFYEWENSEFAKAHAPGSGTDDDE